MKKILSVALQFLIFMLTFAIGSFTRPLHLAWDLGVRTASDVHRSFVPDGLLLMLTVYIFILLIEALMKRVRTSAPWTTLALILAAVLGLSMKLGFITREL